ncbi:MAG: hypothetical protein AB9828_07855 [Sphaerochaetaceae bacterium]|jgi:hypothetical protein
MRKAIVLILAVLMIVMSVSCNNPNKSPTDKVGGYHVGLATVQLDGQFI